MTDAVQYASMSPYDPLPKAACAACGTAVMLVRDHCHEHGWMRDIVCVSCNMYLGIIDKRRATPAVSERRLAALLAVRNRCPDCAPLTAADLKPRKPAGTRTPAPRQYSEEPWAYENRMRRKAARQGYKLMVTRRSDTYTLMPPKGKPRVFGSMNAVEKFLNGS